ncbi:unnamed protein product [Oppiella nova]|uniref:Uncharacterized protein n=1 Tax=Oppiella nova TaxID=334625 RepID=A0A7R9M7Z7_9ACAR|nr:unnamed protein product [Oppiella nova]CAG2171159.1 unnamed protein product [Oppiella nova]
MILVNLKIVAHGRVNSDPGLDCVHLITIWLINSRLHVIVDPGGTSKNFLLLWYMRAPLANGTCSVQLASPIQTRLIRTPDASTPPVEANFKLPVTRSPATVCHIKLIVYVKLYRYIQFGRYKVIFKE